MITLNLGCGNAKKADEIGVDIARSSSADIIADLSTFPFPFKTSSVGYIYSSHFFEHIANTVGLMDEMYRILTPGGILEVIVPHVSNKGYFADPTHQRPFTMETFDYFVKGKKQVVYTDSEFEYAERQLTFSPGLMGSIGKILAGISLRRWEKYHKWRFPAISIHVKLRCLKSQVEYTTPYPVVH